MIALKRADEDMALSYEVVDRNDCVIFDRDVVLGGSSTLNRGIAIERSFALEGYVLSKGGATSLSNFGVLIEGSSTLEGGVTS